MGILKRISKPDSVKTQMLGWYEPSFYAGSNLIPNKTQGSLLPPLYIPFASKIVDKLYLDLKLTSTQMYWNDTDSAIVANSVSNLLMNYRNGNVSHTHNFFIKPSNNGLLLNQFFQNLDGRRFNRFFSNRFNLGKGQNYAEFTIPSLSLNQFHLISWVWNNTAGSFQNRMKCFVDGVEITLNYVQGSTFSQTDFNSHDNNVDTRTQFFYMGLSDLNTLSGLDVWLGEFYHFSLYQGQFNLQQHKKLLDYCKYKFTK